MNDYLLITRCRPRRPHTSPPSRVLTLDPRFFAKPSILRPTAIIPRFPKPLVGSSSLQRLHCSPLSIARLMSSAAHKSPLGREQGGKRRKPTEIEVFDSSPPEESLHIFFKKVLLLLGKLFAGLDLFGAHFAVGENYADFSRANLALTPCLSFLAPAKKRRRDRELTDCLSEEIPQL